MSKRVVVLLSFALLAAIAPASQAQTWKQFGPGPMEASQLLTTNNATVSGIVTDIAIDPSGTTDKTIFIATGAGGIWKTTDGGEHWSPKTDAMPELTMGAVALDPSDPQIVYAGVGGPWFSGAGGGVYRSTDGGNGWVTFNPGGVFTGATINRMVLPGSGLLLVATSQGLYKSVDGGKHFGNDSPHFTNGLAISIAVPGTKTGISNGNITDLKLDTRSAKTVYAAVAGQGLYRSDDIGATFPASGKMFSSASFPSGIAGTVYIAFAQSSAPDNQTFYAILAVSNSAFAMLKSTNGGGRWTRVPLGSDIVKSYQTDYDQTVGVDPQDASKVYIGVRAIYYSSDGATSGFNPNSLKTDPTRIDNNLAHVDQHAIAFSPPTHFTAPPTRLYTGNDGGIATTGGGHTPGSNWKLLNGDLATMLFYSMDFAKGSTANNLYSYGGFQDNGTGERTPLQTGSTSWSLQIGGDSTQVSVDPNDTLHVLTISDGCFTSTTDGKSWATPQPCNINVSKPPKAPAQIPGLTFLLYDPNGHVVYASQNATLFRSTSEGASFTLMHKFPSNLAVMNQVKGDRDTIWVGLSDGTVQKTHDAEKGSQASWTSQTVTGAPSGQAVTGIAIDPINTRSVVVIYPGFSGGDPPAHAFMTTNDGGHWNNIGGTAGGGDSNLPDLPLYSVVIVPTTSPHTIVVGSDAGVMQTTDLGQTWWVLGSGLPHAQVQSLVLDSAVSPPVLRASTFGRSAFELQGSCDFCSPLPKCTDTIDCHGDIALTCTGNNIGAIFNSGTCFDTYGEPVTCYKGFNGSPTLSTGWVYGPFGVTGSGLTYYGVSESAKVCTGSGSQQRCITVSPVPSKGACTAPNNPPPARCSQGETYCTKYAPPMCVPSQDCKLTRPDAPVTP